MKLLKIIASGIPLFNDKCEIDFLAQQRVSADNADEMSCLFSSGQQAYYQKQHAAGCAESLDAAQQPGNRLPPGVSRKHRNLFIKDEFLKSKAISKVKRKADIYEFSDSMVTLTRNKDEEFLLDDVSIIIAYNK